MAANKKPTGGHVVYDSGTDITTGKKRAVLPGGGGVSVAERARLFGAQVAHSSPAKAYNAANHVPERPPLSNQSNRSNAIQQERNYPPPRADVDRRPKQTSSYSNPQRTFNAHHSAVDLNERTRREQVPPSARGAHTYNYPKVPSNYNTHVSQSPPRRRPNNSYDSFQRVSPQRPPMNKPRHTQRMPSESYSSEGEEEDTYSALYDKPPTSRRPNYQSSNYFRPIQDPLEVLFKDSPKEYIQFQAPVRQPPRDTSNLQPFDLGNLISRIQQDYIDNARPYVSSVQFVQHNQSLADIGFLTPAVNRKDYSKRAGDNYHRQAPMSNHYDVIDANGLYPYEQMDPRGYYVDNNYSSIRRRRHHRRYHNQASSPIHILETSSKTTTQPKPETPPVTKAEKAPTPAAESSTEEEDEEKKDESTKQDTTKTAEEGSTEEESEEESEEEDEEEEEEEEKSAPAPALPPPISSVNGTSRFVPPGNNRPPGPYQTPTLARKQPEPSETDESDSDESESESDSDSDGNKKKKKKKTQQPAVVPSPATQSNPPRTAQVTPQTNARAVAQRGNYEKYSLNQVQESSSTVEPIEIPEPEKSGSIGGKLKSFTSKFRRNKS